MRLTRHDGLAIVVAPDLIGYAVELPPHTCEEAGCQNDGVSYTRIFLRIPDGEGGLISVDVQESLSEVAG